MISLSPTWFIEKQIDFEYQKYILLSYLQQIKKSFDDLKLYPEMNDVKFHIQNLESYRTTKKLIENRVKTIKGFDFNTMTLLYDIPDESEDFRIVNEIVEYSEKEFNQIFKIGREIWQEVNGNIVMNFVGIVPEYKKEGFIIIKLNDKLHLCQYKNADIQSLYEPSVILTELDEFEASLDNTFEKIKIEIIGKYKDYSNPSVISAEVKYRYPYLETVLPVIKDKISIKIN